MTVFIRDFDSFKKEEWDKFVSSSINTWLWHTHDFILAKSAWSYHKNLSFAVCETGGNILGIFPCHLIKSKKWKIFYRTHLDNIGGWLTQNQDDQELEFILLKEFFRRMKNYACESAAINFSTASMYHSIDPLYVQGIAGRSSYLNVIDLTLPEEVLWKNVRKGHRSEIKKAEKNGISFHLATPSNLDDYYTMHKDVYAKSSIPPHEKAYFEKIFSNLLPQGAAIIGMAMLEGKPIAMANFGVHKEKAVYWTGASADIAYKTGANHYLQWSMITHLKTHARVSLLDMGEVFLKHDSPKIQGIANFKMGFGGSLKPCYKALLTKKDCQKF